MNELLAISTGLSRRSTSWKKEEWTWKELITKLSKPVVTSETYKQYLASTKDVQDQVKDVGGFVGGIVTGGRRKKGAVGERSLVTLDIDYANVDFWNDFTLSYGCAAVLHGTHKNGPEMIRLRLIVPLKRNLMADEYEAVSRKLAGNLGIELFDHTTFQPERLMYWPSVSADVEYYFESQDGEWLDPDELLAEYFDWKDMSEWPRHPKEKEVVETVCRSQADPLMKSGVIGAFCRTFTIQEAIEQFLSDTYVIANEGRYSYVHGSTSNGAVVYDDKFLYSHHSTDPAGEKLCNAFDLVRLHKFGSTEQSAKDTIDFAMTQPVVIQTLGVDKIADAKSIFGEYVDYEPVENQDVEWLKKMDMTKKGEFLSTSTNITAILENDINLRGRFGYDLFSNKEVALTNLPWRKINFKDNWDRNLKDSDDSGLRMYLEAVYKIYNREKTSDSFRMHTLSKSFHPVRDYLNECYANWDGKARAVDIFIDYLGAEASHYVRQATLKVLVAAVARIFNPGVKFDVMPVLVGPQGTGKSWMVDKLGGKWFSSSMPPIGSKDALEALHGKWILEMGELSRLKVADVDAIKHFLAERIDTFRMAYARKSDGFARQCIFFGTTNNEEFLTDITGNRRFWPITVSGLGMYSVFKDFTTEVVAQVWGEAVSFFRDGESLVLDEEANESAVEIQDSHMEVDERGDKITEMVEMKIPVDWENWNLHRRRRYYNSDYFGNFQETDDSVGALTDRKIVCAQDVWCEMLGLDFSNMSRFNTFFINKILKKMKGWEAFRYIPKAGEKQIRGFRRVTRVRKK